MRKKTKKVNNNIKAFTLQNIMNVVQREKHVKGLTKNKQSLVRKDVTTGIRGTSSFLSVKCLNNPSAVIRPNAPRYNFDHEKIQSTSMGPPKEPSRTTKRKFANTSFNPSKNESFSKRFKVPKILANDSTAEDTIHEYGASRKRLLYISSSGRGTHSGTHSARSTSTSLIEPSTILAISEGRGMARGEIGIAAIDLRRPQLILSQFSDSLLYTHTMTKINIFNPIEIIVPHTFCEGVQTSQLYQLMRDQFPSITLTTVQRRHFNDAVGRQQIQTLCAPEYSAVYLQVLHKFYALTAAAAVLKYVEYIQCVVFARESLKIEYFSSENTMIIDVGTATQLELVQPLVPSAGAMCCLLGVLGPTFTIGGIRALRAAILQPSCNREFIENRLDAVQELMEDDTGLMARLQDVMKKLSDVDKILFLCIESPTQNMDKMGEAQLNQTLLLKTTIDLIPSLIEGLNGAHSGKLLKIKTDLDNSNYKEISDRIHTIIQEDAHVEKGSMGSLQRCFAVKPEINGLLDVARRTYSELIEDIQKIVEQLSETYDLPIRLNQNSMKGFHIIMSIAPKNRHSFKVDDLPPIFIQVQSNGASVSMTTEELVVLDQQAKESLNEIQKMSNMVIYSLLKELRPFMSSLYKLCENVAELDILLALSQASSAGSYIRPEFDNYFFVKNSVHPLLDYNSQVLPISNDISATPEHNFTIITGPNMGGKSIYIKQIAFMQIMSQLGCFIPATSATLRLSDRMFSRIGFNDSVELNASTYVLEMKEIQHILKALTPTSLVIIDELCRGTCSEEGTSMAWAICEELLMSDAFTFFTTHFIYLTRLQDLYFNVVNLHTTVSEESIPDTEDKTRLIYEHKVETGITKIEHYGLALAANTNLPPEVVNFARELAQFIAKSKKPQEITSVINKEESLLYKLNAEIRQIMRRNESCEEEIKQIINNFKVFHPTILEKIKNWRVSNSDVGTVTDNNNIETSNTTNLSSKDQSIIYKAVNKIPQMDIGTSRDLDISKDKAKYTTVKSINELMNTVIENFNDEVRDCLTEPKATKEVLTTSHNEDGIEKSVTMFNDTSIENDIVQKSTNENLSQNVGYNESDDDTDSEIAEALTQLIVECDVHYNASPEQMDDFNFSQNHYPGEVNEDDQVSNIDFNYELSTSSTISSIDKELMVEAIDEINEELNYSRDIITPPLGFRDEQI